MKKYIKAIVLTAFLIAISSLANAKVINLYDMKNYEFFGSGKILGYGHNPDDPDDPDAVYECNPDDGTYKSKPEGKDCVLKSFSGGTKCYTDCKCSTSVYKYSSENCKGPYFSAPTDEDMICSDGGDVYYKECECGYNLLSSLADDYTTYFNTLSGIHTIKSIDGSETFSCYDPKLFTCKNDYVELTRNDVKSGRMVSDTRAVITTPYKEPLSYSVVTNLPYSDTSSLSFRMCVIGVDSLDSAYAFEKEPVGKKQCAIYKQSSALYFPSKRYYHYVSDCSSAGSCYDSSEERYECTNYVTEKIDYYHIGSGEGTRYCEYEAGCKKGWVDDTSYSGDPVKSRLFCDENKSIVDDAFISSPAGTYCMSVDCARNVLDDKYQNITTIGYEKGIYVYKPYKRLDDTKKKFFIDYFSKYGDVKEYTVISGEDKADYILCHKIECPDNAYGDTYKDDCNCKSGYTYDGEKCVEVDDYCPTLGQEASDSDTGCSRCDLYISDSLFDLETKSCDYAPMAKRDCTLCPPNSTYSETLGRCLCKVGTYYDHRNAACLNELSSLRMGNHTMGYGAVIDHSDNEGTTHISFSNATVVVAAAGITSSANYYLPSVDEIESFLNKFDGVKELFADIYMKNYTGNTVSSMLKAINCIFLDNYQIYSLTNSTAVYVPNGSNLEDLENTAISDCLEYYDEDKPVAIAGIRLYIGRNIHGFEPICVRGCTTCPSGSHYDVHYDKCFCDIGTYYDGNSECVTSPTNYGIVGYDNSRTSREMVAADFSTGKTVWASSGRELTEAIRGHCRSIDYLFDYSDLRDVRDYFSSSLANAGDRVMCYAYHNSSYHYGMLNISSGQGSSYLDSSTVINWQDSPVLSDCINEDGNQIGGTIICKEKFEGFAPSCSVGNCPEGATYLPISGKCLCDIGKYYDGNGGCSSSSGKYGVVDHSADGKMIVADFDTGKTLWASNGSGLISAADTQCGSNQFDMGLLKKVRNKFSVSFASAGEHTMCYIYNGGLFNSSSGTGETYYSSDTASTFIGNSVLSDCVNSSETKIGGTIICKDVLEGFDGY